MKKKALLVLFLIFALLVSGCNSTGGSQIEDGSAGAANANRQDLSSPEESDNASDASVFVPVDTSELFSDRDYKTDYDESKSALIRLNGDTAVCSSDAVQISGSTVTITEEGTYILSGSLDDGMIIVDTAKDDKTQLVLDGAAIHSETCAPIYVLQSDKVFITTAPGTTNTLSNGGTFEDIDENNIDAVIFSKEDITLNGSGTLVITSPAGHGIVSKDSLTITGGSYNISCTSHGLAGKDDVCIAGGDFIIASGKDGIHAENEDDESVGFVCILGGTYNISAEGDGISSASYMQIEDGTFEITSGGGSINAASESSDSWGSFMGGGRPQSGRPGGSGGGPMGSSDRNPMDSSDGGSMEGFEGGSSPAADSSGDSSSIKGIKAAASLIISGGVFVIDSADDSVHSNASVAINGGTFEIASGDDAFHADETLTITAGEINITESYEGLEGLHILISGGDITLTASDDGINAAGGTDSSGMTGGRDGMFGGPGMSFASNGSVTISGGTLNVTAYGDGIDANGTLDITGGYIIVCGPTQGDTATLDYDTRATISGGTFIGTGASNMAQTFSDTEQGVIAVSVGSQYAGTEIKLTDSNGNTIISYAPDLSFAVVIVSSPDVIKGDTYTITVGSASGEFAAG